MLSNDESKRLMIRFKRSKDFNKLCKKLEKEGYKVFKSDSPIIVNGEPTSEMLILVGRGLQCLISVSYYENEDATSDYKQVINYMQY